MSIKTQNQPVVDITVSDVDQVNLTIQIGDAQLGGSLVRFQGDPNILAEGDANDVFIGTGADLKGKTLLVTTNVVDVNPATLDISIDHNFSAGNQASASLRDAVDNPGDFFSWVTSYNFK